MPQERLKEVAAGQATLYCRPEYEHLMRQGWDRVRDEIRLAGKSSAEVLKTKVETPWERREGAPSTQIVVKKGTSASVKREFENYLMYEGLTGVRSVTPIGYVDHGNGTGHLYTLFEENAIPLKSINFRSMRNGDRMNLLRECARGIAMLHKQNVAHNDLKLKNILYTQEKPTDPLIVMDVAKSVKSRKPLSHQASLYDLLAFIGDAHHEELIRRPGEMDLFLHHYLSQREPEKYAQKNKKDQQKYRSFVKALLVGKLPEHEGDVVIQNAAKLFVRPLTRTRREMEKKEKAEQPPLPDIPLTKDTFKKMNSGNKNKNGS